MGLPSSLPTVLFLTIILTMTPAQANANPILTSSFTWNPHCGPTVACGPSAAGSHGTGFAASNNLTYAGCTNLGGGSVDCSAASIVSGVGNGCGQCWHITPQSSSFPSNGVSMGTSVVVKINDQCTDGGYCDQKEAHATNTGYGKDVHIDLCADSGVAAQFFGALGPGVVTGLAQLLPDCSALNNGPFGSGLGSLDGSSSASSSPSSSGNGSPSSKSPASSSSGGDSSSSSGSSSSSSSQGDTSSSSGGSASSNPVSNLSNLGSKLGKQKLSSGHDGQRAGAQVVGGTSNGGSNDALNAGSTNGGVSSSSPAPPASSLTPTTLVAVVSSSSTPGPVSSSVPVDAQDGVDEGEDCEYGDSGEL